MDIIRVHDLLQLEEGTSSTIEKCSLVGRIVVMEDESNEYARGSVVLQDATTNETIACNVDRCFPHLHNNTVHITAWNYIYNEIFGIQLVEFLIEHVNTSMTTAQSVLKELLQFDSLNFESALAFGLPYYTPSSIAEIKEQIEEEAQINISGVVIAKSTVQTTSQMDTFFIQITEGKIGDAMDIDENEEKRPVVTILFKGNNLIKYYHSFSIGWAYSFQRLQKTKEVLLYIEYQSSSHNITLRQLADIPALLQSTPSSQAQQESTQYPLEISQIPAESYPNMVTSCTYTITRVIDSYFGIYEIDHKYTLCLFYYRNYQRSLPYRCQTRLRLHNVHVVSVEPAQNGDSLLFDAFWEAPFTEAPPYTTPKKSYVFLVACTNSNVEVASFPNHCECFEFNRTILLDSNDEEERTDLIENRIRALLFAYCKEAKATFAEFIQHLELVATFCSRFDAYEIEALCQTFVDKTIKEEEKAEFMQDWHHNNCRVLPRHNAVQIIIVTYPTLQVIYERLSSELKDHTVHLAGSNTFFETANIDRKQSTFNEALAGYRVLGKLHMSEDGRLYLMDQTMRILLSVSSAFASTSGTEETAINSGIAFLGGTFCIIRQLQLFEEDLSYARYDDENEGIDGLLLRPPLWHRYIACLETHIEQLCNVEENRVKPFQFRLSRRAVQDDKLESFGVIQATTEVKRILQTNRQFVVARVIQQQPITALVRSDDTPALESRIIVKLYAIDFSWLKDSYNMGTAKFKKTLKKFDRWIFVLSAKHKSLKYSKMMKPNSFWTIFGLDDGNEMERAITIDTEKHSICPITILPNESQSEYQPLMQLYPRFSKMTPVPSTAKPRIYNISDLNHENLPKELREQLAKGHNCVNVQGIVITKRLLEDKPDKCIPNNIHILQLYEEYGISAGKANRQIYLQIRQLNTLDVLDIYMDLTAIQYPSGLMEGSFVKIYNVRLKFKGGNEKSFYGRGDISTYVDIISFDASQLRQQPLRDHAARPVTNFSIKLPVKQLASIHYDHMLQDGEMDEMKIYHIYGCATKVWHLESSWHCRHCGTIVRQNDRMENECTGFCKTASKVYSLMLKADISDATGFARMYVDGERLVSRLLQLSPRYLDALKEATSKYGSIVYNIDWVDDDDEQRLFTQRIGASEDFKGFTLKSLCKRATGVGNVHMYVKVVSGKKEKPDDAVTPNQQRTSILERSGLKKQVLVNERGAVETSDMAKKLTVKAVDVQTHDEYVKNYPF